MNGQTSEPAPRRIALALTGASGAQYGLRLLEVLLRQEHRVQLMISKPAQVVIGTETDWALPGRVADYVEYFSQRFGTDKGLLSAHGAEEWSASCASGSSPPDAMAVCPCSMATLSSIAAGSSRSLIERAADVMLKEQRKLVLVPRETPFSAIHLENMLKLARLGVVILPPAPGFYGYPKGGPGSVDDMIDFVVARVLDHLHVPHSLGPRWGKA
ncbi:MAG TPA: flavin prenyltransferase UbiX [Gammaproteobacteria bacterium]